MIVLLGCDILAAIAAVLAGLARLKSGRQSAVA
jgi:hypothetical protein